MNFYPLTTSFINDHDFNMFERHNSWMHEFLEHFGLIDEHKQFKPDINIYETDDKLIFELALAGFKKEDIKIEVVESSLKISGSRKNNLPEDAKLLKQERSMLEFTRNYKLSDNIKKDICQASYKRGLLQVSFEKDENSKPRLIDIN